MKSSIASFAATAAVAAALASPVAAASVQYTGYGGSYLGWDDASLQRAAAGGADSDLIVINQCQVDGTWATWSTGAAIWEFTELNLNNQGALLRLASCHGPKAPNFSSFAADAVRHAAAIVPIRAVQIWNEPNLATNWAGSIKPVEYSKMLISASAAVKAVGSFPVISAGLAPVHNNSTSCTANDSTWMCPQDYLNRLNLLRVAIDGVGSHLYPIQTSAITASSALSDIQNEYKAIESIDQKKLGARPIWVTETGVKTNNYVSGSLQGSITMTYRDWLTAQSDLAGVYVWNIIDDSNGNPTYGVLNKNGNPKAGPLGTYCRTAAQRGLTPTGC